MTNEEIFFNLFSGGKYSLPYLVQFSHPTAGTIRLVNDVQSVRWGEDLYAAATFDYTEPNAKGEGGSLSISALENGLIEFFENSDSRLRLDVVGVIAADGTVQQIKSYVHFFGSISYGDDQKIEYTCGKDDRLDMNFCPYNYDADTNRGNA